MAKYIILNGKVYNIKWQKKLYYFDKTLIAKIFIRHLERDRAKNEPQSLQMPDDSFFIYYPLSALHLKHRAQAVHLPQSSCCSVQNLQATILHRLPQQL